jgi:List-Bact-rpt repeat protein
VAHRANGTGWRCARVVVSLAAVLLVLLARPPAGDAAQLELSWADNSDNEAAFSIERRTGAGAFARIATQPAGRTTYVDATVVTGTMYCYRVRAYNVAGSSPYSNEACGTAGGTLALTVTRAGTGVGSLTSTPGGIICGTDCSQSYAATTPVTLSAYPDRYSIFSGWSGGGCSGVAPCTVTGNTAVRVTGTFTATYLLTVSRLLGQGVIRSSPWGISCGIDCWQRYASGTAVTLTAVPPAGKVFYGWSGSCKGTGPCTLTLTGNTSVWAAFQP